MRKYVSMILIFLGVMLCTAQQNMVQINGSTNINKFKCSNTNFKFDKGSYSFLANRLPEISLNVNEFDCGNGMMTKDFRKTLKADIYPRLYISFVNFIKKSNNKYSADVEVKMMNKTVRYNIDFSLINNKLIGSRIVNFSDFGITPPRKMGGMIVVRDSLNMVFNMAAKD